MGQNVAETKHQVFITVSLLALLVLFVIGFMIWVGWQAGSIEPKAAFPETTIISSDPLVSPAQPLTPPIEAIDPVRGNPSAPVTVIYFSDFNCPYCIEMSTVWEQILTEYGSQIRFVWKDYSFGQGSLALHKGARCAQLQGRFWEFYDAIFDGQIVGSPTTAFAELAESLGLDTVAYTECLAGEQAELVVFAGTEQALSIGIEAAPSYFVNDVFVEGQASYEEVVALIESELNN